MERAATISEREQMLMRLPKRQKQKAPETGDAVADLRRDLEVADAERADAVRVRQDLEDRRGDVMMDEDEAALEAHDNAVAAARRRIDIAESRHARLTLELNAAEAAVEQARRRAIYETAERKMKEARRLLAEEYLPAARLVADIVKRADKLRFEAAEANKDLPEDTLPIDLMVEPEFNGSYFGGSGSITEEREYFVNRITGQRAGPCDLPTYHSNRDRWERRTETVERSIPLVPAERHRAVAEFLNLPGLKSNEYIYGAPHWGQPRA